MNERVISLTTFKQNLGEFVKQAAYGGERIILLTHGKPQVAIISIDDLKKLESLELTDQQEISRPDRVEAWLLEARTLRKQIENEGKQTDSVQLLNELREERMNELIRMY